MHLFLAAHGLHGLQADFFAAQGLQGLHLFLAAQGLHGLQPFFFAAQGLHDAASNNGRCVAFGLAPSATAFELTAPIMTALPINAAYKGLRFRFFGLIQIPLIVVLQLETPVQPSTTKR